MKATSDFTSAGLPGSPQPAIAADMIPICASGSVFERKRYASSAVSVEPSVSVTVPRRGP